MKSMTASASILDFADAAPPSANAAELEAFDSAAMSLNLALNCHTSSSTTPNQPANHASCSKTLSLRKLLFFDIPLALLHPHVPGAAAERLM